MKALTKIAILFFSIALTGCATYGAGLDRAIIQIKMGDYAAGEKSIQAALKPTGNDRLLYHLELAIVKHLEGDFTRSNQLLEQAERIAEDLETKQVTDPLVLIMSNPRKGPYAAADFKHIKINNLKSINSFALAEEAKITANI